MINRRSMLKIIGLAPVAAPVLAVLPSPVYADGGLVSGKTAIVGEVCSETVIPTVSVFGSADRELMRKIWEISSRTADAHLADYLRHPYRRG